MMPENLKKAVLQEIRWDKDQQVEVGDKKLEVQFNPDSLKLTYSNQNASGDQRGGSAVQYVGSGTTKLSFDLWFDVTSAHLGNGTPPNDVRALSGEVVFFITPQKSGKKNKFIPPGVRFHWGSFLFEGVMDSLNESLEYFSEEGLPLRAKVSIGLTRQEIKYEAGEAQAGSLATANSGQPPQQAQEGDNVQDLAGDDWADTAAANGIENPRDLEPGSFLDTAAGGLGGGISGGVAGGLGGGVSAGLSAGASFSAGGGLSGGVSGGLRAGASIEGGAGIGGGVGGGLGGGIGGGLSAGVGGGLSGGISGGIGGSIGGGVGGSIGGGISGGVGGSIGGGSIGGGISGSVGGGSISGGVGGSIGGGSIGGGISGSVGGGSISGSLSGGLSGGTSGGAAGSAKAAVNASFDARLQR